MFGFDGFNIARCDQVLEGNHEKAFQMYSRELVFYTDLHTGEVIEEWTNSKGQRVEVLVCACEGIVMCVCMCG